MKIKGTNQSAAYRASTIMTIYGCTIEQARSLKTGDILDMADDVAAVMIGNGLAVATITEQIDNESRKLAAFPPDKKEGD